MSSPEAASSEKRRTSLDREGEGYTLVLWEDKTAKLGVAIDSKDDIVGKRDSEKGLKWHNSRGVGIEGTAYKLVTKGSSFVFEGERYPVEEDTPFEPANAPAMAPGVDQTDSWAETVSAPLVELPLAKKLRALLESHPQQKAPIESAVLTSWEGRVAKKNLAPFFAASTQNCCVVLGYEIIALLLSPQPVVGENEDGCHGLIDQCVAKPLKLFAPEFRLRRNSSQDSSSYPLKRPDFSATVVGKGCFFRGEEKKMDSNENPAAELHVKLQVWPFPGIPFVLGYWSVGTSIHFCKVSKDNSEEIMHYELSSALGRLHCWNAIRNVSRLMKYMASTYMSLVPNDMVDNHLVHTAPTDWTRTIKYSGGHVLKEIALRDGETQQKLNRVLAVLDKLKHDSNSIQGVLPIIKYNLSSSVNDNEKRRRVQPCLYIMTSFGKACSRPSDTFELTFLVHFLLETVRSLHENGITHRDIRLPNILQDIDDNYGLIDWDDSVVGLENLPNNEVAHLAAEEHAPEMFVEGNTHDCRVDLWSIGHVIGQFDDVADQDLRNLKDQLMAAVPTDRISVTAALEALDNME